MKTNFIVSVETKQRLDNELQGKLLENIRDTLSGVTNTYPEVKVSVMKKITDDDIVEAIYNKT